LSRNVPAGERGDTMSGKHYGSWRDAASFLEHRFPQRWGDPMVRVLKQAMKQVKDMAWTHEARLGVKIKEAAANGDELAVALVATLAKLKAMLAARNASNPINIPDEPAPSKKPRKRRGK
jgi:hypothetical protein